MASYQTRLKADGTKQYRAIVRLKGAPPLSKSFHAQADAKKWAVEMESRIQRGGNVNFNDLKKLLVSDLMRRYMEEVSMERDSGKFEVNRLKSYMREPWAKLDLNADIASALRTWRDQRLKVVTSATVIRDFGVLGSMFTHAMTEWGLPMQNNPAHLVKKPKEVGGERSRLWTDHDLKIWYDYFGYDMKTAPSTKTSYIPWILNIARVTGLRLGEICRIEMKNIDLSVPQIYFAKTKNGDEFFCPLRKDAVEVIRVLAQMRKGEENLVGIGAISAGELFRRERAVIAEQFPEQADIVIHSLRHTYTTEMVTRVPDKLALMRMTGRRTLQSLARYYKPKAGDLATMMG
jgi:integrase